MASNFARRMGKRIDHVPKETMDAFVEYSWPGNVRELQNLVERAVILSNDCMLPNPLRASHKDMDTMSSTRGMFTDSQRALILQTLEAAGWVVGGPGGAAARLGLKRTTLISKMKKLGISRPLSENGVSHFGGNQESQRPIQPANPSS